MWRGLDLCNVRRMHIKEEVSKGGFIHASRAAGSILLSTSNIC